MKLGEDKIVTINKLIDESSHKKEIKHATQVDAAPVTTDIEQSTSIDKNSRADNPAVASVRRRWMSLAAHRMVF